MERIGDEIRRELARFGPSAGMTEIVAAWPEAVGEAIAQNAWPARIGRDGTLHVHAADAIWAFELGQRAQEIAERVGVERIRFAPGPLPGGPAEGPAQPHAEAPKPLPEHLERAAEIAAEIEDEGLRETVARAAAASLAREPSDRTAW
jgi:predicted nucleic acid-binding Zn ribbon protein